MTEVTRPTPSGEESRGPTNTTVNYPSTALTSSCLYQTFFLFFTLIIVILEFFAQYS